MRSKYSLRIPIATRMLAPNSVRRPTTVIQPNGAVPNRYHCINANERYNTLPSAMAKPIAVIDLAGR